LRTFPNELITTYSPDT